MAYHWFSFSKDGKNQGVMNIEADPHELAVKKAKGLGVPDFDDVESFLIPEPEIPLDILVSSQEMKDRKYESFKYLK